MRTFTKTEHKAKLIHKLKGIIQQEIKPPDLVEEIYMTNFEACAYSGIPFHKWTNLINNKVNAKIR